MKIDKGERPLARGLPRDAIEFLDVGVDLLRARARGNGAEDWHHASVEQERDGAIKTLGEDLGIAPHHIVGTGKKERKPRVCCAELSKDEGGAPGQEMPKIQSDAGPFALARKW